MLKRGKTIMGEFDKVKYNAKFNKDNYKQISFWFNKNKLDLATVQAQQKGYDTINSYAKALLEEALFKRIH